jgi:hypothetical protein
LHPLESAAFSRRTPEAEVPTRYPYLDADVGRGRASPGLACWLNSAWLKVHDRSAKVQAVGLQGSCFAVDPKFHLNIDALLDVLGFCAEGLIVTHKQSDPVKVAQWRVNEIGLFHGDTWNDSGPIP